MAAEQRRSAVIGPASFLHLPSAVIGITIETAIAAGIVKSEVYASGTPALGTLVLILLCVDRAAGKLCDQFAVDTAAVPDIAIGQINFFRTSIYCKAAGCGNGRQISGQGGDTAAGYFPDPQRPDVISYCGIHVNKADRAFSGIAAELSGQFREGAVVPAGCIGFIENDGIIPPDDPLFSNHL